MNFQGLTPSSWAYHTQRGWLTTKEYPDGQDSGTARDPGPAYTYTAAGRLKTRERGQSLDFNIGNF